MKVKTNYSLGNMCSILTRNTTSSPATQLVDIVASISVFYSNMHLLIIPVLRHCVQFLYKGDDMQHYNEEDIYTTEGFSTR
jgi:hypothetical protein